MLFNSYEFIFVFLPITLIGFNILLRKTKGKEPIIFLCIMSMIFYFLFDYRYLLILLASSLCNLCLSYFMKKNKEKEKNKLLMIIGIIFNICLLGYFKYTNFFIENISAISGKEYSSLNIILPVGISFYTFSQIAFLVNRYKGDLEHENIFYYMLYISYFPKILQGPIAEPKFMIDQFKDREKLLLTKDKFSKGIVLFVIGLSKKMLIADVFADLVSYTFSQYYYLDTICIFIAGISSALNIYFDFSGYCDMADGISTMLGIELPQNFNSPYKSKSVRQLWQRWHMTLNEFLIKYVYIPLGGSRVGRGRYIFNVLFIFFLSGLWHGAGWTYIVWGLLNGVMVVIDNLIEQRKNKVTKKEYKENKIIEKVRTTLTFLFFSFSVLFFEAPTMEVVISMVKSLFFFTWPGFVIRSASNVDISYMYIFQKAASLLGTNVENTFYLIQMILLFAISFYILSKDNAREIAKKKLTTKRATILAILFTLCILSLNDVQTYVYFNF